MTSRPGTYSCSWARYPDAPDDAWTAGTDPDHGAEYYLSDQAQIVQIDGFAVVQTASGLGPVGDNCQLYLDLAPGQSLEVQYVNGRKDHPGINHELACQLASHAAELMLATLKARHNAGTG